MPLEPQGEMPREPLLIVALGASAGGLEALEQFFAEMPPDSGMAFVVVTHLHPGRVSLMPELLQRHCSMPVVQVAESIPVEPNKVYLGPPGRKLEILNGTLHSESLEVTRTMLIDAFFRSLARDQKDRSIGIVLSGTGTDGTLGLKEIKGSSGMTMAQEEASARYAGMPHSAIAGVQVDFILPPQEMPKRLLAYARGVQKRVQVGAELVRDRESEENLARIFLLLRNRTKHDFSQYKAATIRRRIERRMNVHQIDTLADYVRFLQQTPQEVDRLFKELLIGVTSFFRDPEAFDALGGALTEILTEKPQDYVVRVWVTGCSTGEEAYTIAILFRETMERLGVHNGVQIFATDLDDEAIEFARVGLYPESISADVSPKRLERFFTKDENSYRVRKEVRESIVFAPQNVLEDPPFTKLDLLCCRNLLIYLDAALQQRLVPMFHYALHPGGLLFLGSSETIGSLGHLFESVDKKWKVFRRKEVPSGTYVADLPSGRRDGIGAAFAGPDLTPRLPIPRTSDHAPLPAAERAILSHLVPPTVLMHERGEIVHIHGRTGLFLEPAPGSQAHANIYNMAREGLAIDLAVAVRRAAGTEGEVIHRGARVKTNGDTKRVDLRVRKLARPDVLAGLYLVAFELTERSPGEAVSLAAPGAGADVTRTHDLEHELQHTRDMQQTTVEQLETANEELKSTNEELQSTNEELQSTNEELETSKEEMQSLNEELQTVNAELQGKLEQLARANDDMNNLLNGTDIATVFLDRDLNIKRFTEQTKRIMRLIPSDVGRPIGDLVSKLNYAHLVEDAREVLRTLVFKEAELRSEDGAWFLSRILPYRTGENVIDGLVLTFVDISKVKGLQEEARLVIQALRNSRTSVFGQSRDLDYTWVFGSVFGRSTGEIVGRKDHDLLSERDADTLGALKRGVLEKRSPVRERVRLTIAGESRAYDLFLAPLPGDGEEASGVTGIVTELDGGGPEVKG
jgi:two-component system CheB/CheR fusion protein